MGTLIPFAHGMTLGMGYNSFTQEPALTNAVTIVEDKKLERDSGQTVDFKADMVHSSSDLAKMLDVSASLAISTGGLKATGAGRFLNEEKIQKADLNFVVKCTVTNSYKAPKTDPVFNWIPQDSKQDFLQVYGDSFISQILEGGQFIGVVSLKSKSSSDIQKIQAELDVGLSMVQAKGKGAFDTSKMMTMANTSVSVAYSGAEGVNANHKTWDMNVMLDEACNFAQKVAKAKISVAALLKPYTTVPSFVKHNISDKLLQSFDNATLLANNMLNAFSALQALGKEVQAMIQQATNESTPLFASENGNAYAADVSGLTAAQKDIQAARDAIRENDIVLKNSPDATTDIAKSKLKKYAIEADIRPRLPYFEKDSSGGRSKPIFGSSVASCPYSGDSREKKLLLFWQLPDTNIVLAPWSSIENWTQKHTTVAQLAAVNTSISALMSADGIEQRLFYLNDQRKLCDRKFRQGDKTWSDGGLNDALIKMSTSINHDFTQISCLRQSNGTLLVFYQNTASLVMIGTYTLTDKKWNLEPLKGPASMNVEVARGGAIVSTLLNTDSDPLKESYALFYQNPQLQVVCLQYVPGAVPTWESTGDTVPTVPYSRLSPPQARLTAYKESPTTVTITGLDASNAITSTTWDSATKKWSNEETVDVGIKGGSLAVACWTSAVKKVFAQQGDKPDLNEWAYNAEKKTWISAGPIGST